MDTTPPPRKPHVIVVGVDGSEQSIAALELAGSLVLLAGDVIRAVKVWQYPVGFGTASMIVVGSRGHGGFVGLLLGSVSSAVAERSACPVVIAHGAIPSSAGGPAVAQPATASA